MSRFGTVAAALACAVAYGVMAPVAGATEEAQTQIAAASSLDGTTWNVKVTPDQAAAQEGEKAFDDTLVFENGQVTMTECVKHGFTPSAYSPGQGPSTFKAEQMSQDAGKTEWTGATTGENIQGIMTWTKKDGKILKYNFQGQKAQTPSAS
jgi:hypothetical protein